MLESRYLLDGGLIEITGDRRSNVIAVSLNTTTQHIEVRVDGVNPDLANPNGYPIAEVTGLRIHGMGGHDQIAVESAITVPTEIFGESGNDTISGGDGSDTIDGGPGHDSISGGDGHDSISGSSGHDTIHGESDEDVIDGGTGNDQLYGEEDEDSLHGGPGKDSLSGGDDHDELDGDAGNDQLDGGHGDDLLHTGSGRDSLIGGPGADIFGPATKGGMRVDFNPTEDLEITQVVMPDFSLPDLNPNSATYNQNVGPSVFHGSVSAYYFTHAG